MKYELWKKKWNTLVLKCFSGLSGFLFLRGYKNGSDDGNDFTCFLH